MKARLYSLFEQVSANPKRYKQISTLAYRKASAVRIFQGRLLNGALGNGPVCCLRPIKTTASNPLGYTIAIEGIGVKK